MAPNIHTGGIKNEETLLVEKYGLVRDQEVAGSNPVAPTMKEIRKYGSYSFSWFFVCRVVYSYIIYKDSYRV